jgi:hypothetical protein
MAAANATPEENEGNHNNKSMVKISVLFLSWQALKGLVRLQALVHGHTMTCHNSTGYGSSCVVEAHALACQVKMSEYGEQEVKMPHSSKQRRGGWEGWAHHHISSTDMTCTFDCIQFLFKLTFLFLTKQPTFLTHRLFCQALPHDRAGPNVQEWRTTWSNDRIATTITWLADNMQPSGFWLSCKGSTNITKAAWSLSCMHSWEESQNRGCIDLSGLIINLQAPSGRIQKQRTNSKYHTTALETNQEIVTHNKEIAIYTKCGDSSYKAKLKKCEERLHWPKQLDHQAASCRHSCEESINSGYIQVQLLKP